MNYFELGFCAICTIVLCVELLCVIKGVSVKSKARMHYFNHFTLCAFGMIDSVIRFSKAYMIVGLVCFSLFALFALVNLVCERKETKNHEAIVRIKDLQIKHLMDLPGKGENV